MPLTVRSVPPVTGPRDGHTIRAVGTGMYVKLSPSMAYSPPASVVSAKATAPPAALSNGGDTHVSSELDTRVAGTCTAPNTHSNCSAVSAGPKCQPLTCTVVPPDTGPNAGISFVTTGVAR